MLVGPTRVATSAPYEVAVLVTILQRMRILVRSWNMVSAHAKARSSTERSRRTEAMRTFQNRPEIGGSKYPKPWGRFDGFHRTKGGRFWNRHRLTVIVLVPQPRALAPRTRTSHVRKAAVDNTDVTFEEFAKRHGLVPKFGERDGEYLRLGRFYCSLVLAGVQGEPVVVMKGRLRIGTTLGNGQTRGDAILDLAKNLRGQKLVVDVVDDYRRDLARCACSIVLMSGPPLARGIDGPCIGWDKLQHAQHALDKGWRAARWKLASRMGAGPCSACFPLARHQQPRRSMAAASSSSYARPPI